MKAPQVLDYQRSLRDGLRTTRYRRYLDTFLQSLLTKSGWNARVVESLRGDKFADIEVSVLEIAYAFHVDSEMIPLIRHLSAGLDEEVLWEKEVFPTDRGFLMFDEPLVTMDIRGENTALSALTWRWGAGPNGDAGAWVTLYSRWDDPLDSVSVTLRAKYGDDHLRPLGPLHINHVQFIPWGTSLGAARQAVGIESAAHYAIAGDPIEAGIEYDNPLRGLYTTLALMGQTITDVADETLTPHLKRFLGKKRIPPRVVVIKLRRTDSGAKQPGETMVQWSHRWVVRAHWKHQHYGPGNSKVKVILIAPGIRGPADKPLVITDKVYSLDR